MARWRRGATGAPCTAGNRTAGMGLVVWVACLVCVSVMSGRSGAQSPGQTVNAGAPDCGKPITGPQLIQTAPKAGTATVRVVASAQLTTQSRSGTPSATEDSATPKHGVPTAPPSVTLVCVQPVIGSASTKSGGPHGRGSGSFDGDNAKGSSCCAGWNGERSAPRWERLAGRCGVAPCRWVRVSHGCGTGPVGMVPCVWIPTGRVMVPALLGWVWGWGHRLGCVPCPGRARRWTAVDYGRDRRRP
jgi:hypothetical protein